MAQAPYAILKVSVAGGGAQTGGITATSGQSLLLSADTTAALGALSYRFEILDYPETFAEPAGWDTDANGVYFYAGASPPAFNAPTLPLWGKLMLALTINAGDVGISGNETADMIDTTTAVQTLSSNGLEDIGFGESNQFDDDQWVGIMKRNLRIIDGVL